MCAIFGLLDFQGKLTPAQRRVIFRELANAAQIRGTDASGVAYVQNGAVQIQKAPRPAHKMRWRIAPEAVQKLQQPPVPRSGRRTDLCPGP